MFVSSEDITMFIFSPVGHTTLVRSFLSNHPTAVPFGPKCSLSGAVHTTVSGNMA